MTAFGDVTVTVADDYVAVVEIDRPPNNHFDSRLIGSLGEAFESIADDAAVRASVLCTTGRVFCAGADLSTDRGPAGAIYAEAWRIFATPKPIVAAVQGAAIGGGFGLALAADFRVAAPEARFASNFTRLGFHHGFALTVTLPALVGQQMALDMMFTGRRVKGDEALAKGLCDRLVPLDQVRSAAHELAAEIGRSAPLAVRSTRATMRGDIVDRVRAAMAHEADQQGLLRTTDDHAEGVRASAERRLPDFHER